MAVKCKIRPHRLEKETRQRLPNRERDCQRLDDMLTTKVVAYMFKCSELTITIWRETKGLPYVIIPGDGRDAIRFKMIQVRVWARRNNKTYRSPKVNDFYARHFQ